MLACINTDACSEGHAVIMFWELLSTPSYRNILSFCCLISVLCLHWTIDRSMHILLRKLFSYLLSLHGISVHLRRSCRFSVIFFVMSPDLVSNLYRSPWWLMDTEIIDGKKIKKIIKKKEAINLQLYMHMKMTLIYA